MNTGEQGKMKQAYFTDSNSLNTAPTLERLDYDPAALIGSTSARPPTSTTAQESEARA